MPDASQASPLTTGTARLQPKTVPADKPVFIVRMCEYDEYSSPCSGTKMAFAAGAVVVVALLACVVFAPARTTQLGGELTSVCARVVARVSGRATTSKAAAVLPNAAPGSTADAVEAPPGVSWQAMTDAQKEGKKKELLAYLKAHKHVALMCYAPWCSHCHTAMPSFTGMKPTAASLLAVNCEALPKTVFAENGPLPLSYFPQYFSVVDGKATPQSTAEAALAAADEAAAAKPAPADEDVMAKKAVVVSPALPLPSYLQMLF